MNVAIYTRESGTRKYKPASPRAAYSPDTTFCLRYTQDGKRRWEQLDVKSYKEAQAASLKKLTELITQSCKQKPDVGTVISRNLNLPAPHPRPLKPIQSTGELMLDAAIDKYIENVQTKSSKTSGVRYPPPDAIKSLLAGASKGQTPLKIGTLIARGDVAVDISAERIAARHLAILAMTGGGKTVAARRVLREFIDLGYPLLIFDPHGDYLGLWEKQSLFPGTEIKLFYPHLVMSDQNQRIVETLIAKMTEGLTPPQQEVMSWLLGNIQPKAGGDVLNYIRALGAVADNLANKKEKENKNSGSFNVSSTRVVRRSLRMVQERLEKMEVSNSRLRSVLKSVKFEPLPDPEGRPEGIIRPKQVSILYLGGYDHLTQSTIVSIVMEALFSHRAELADRIAPFLAVVEEAHNFIPSAREGTEETPSLMTLRKAITEGRKFGVGLVLITQRPSRVDETILAQCNSFLVMRLVNPKDQAYVRSVMENLPESDARLLPGFGPGQGIISGQAVRFPLLVKIKFDAELVGTQTGDEDFITRAKKWKPDAKAGTRAKAAAAAVTLSAKPARKG